MQFQFFVGSPSPARPSLVISVVSHGHAAMVQHLLQQLAARCTPWVTRVVLTQNLPEPAPSPPNEGWPFVLDVRTNTCPLGFAANHNRALQNAPENLYCVLNPDVDFGYGNPFPAFQEKLADPDVALAYPLQLNSQGRLQDSERMVPTPLSLFKRYVLRRLDHKVEWVNGAFWVVKAEVWHSLQGMNTQFFMYCEDVDFCLRLRLAGWQLARANCQVIHSGQRASRRQWRHACWHIKALLHLWSSAVFWQSRRILTSAPVAEWGTQEK